MVGPGDDRAAQGMGRATLTRRFTRFAAIDWSGQAVARPKGLAVAEVGDSGPALVEREGGWSRDAVLGWLVELAGARADMVIGLDLSPALPFLDRDSYFPGWDGSPGDARSLWAMVDRMSADDPYLAASSVVADEEVSRQRGNGRARRWGSGRVDVDLGRLDAGPQRQTGS